tara:strand:+ start:9145 stop:10464 length:1320 start_codon:yes stop_codon:yes gene_type:complete
MASIVNISPYSQNPLALGLGMAQGLGNLSRQGMQNQLMRQTLGSQVSAQNAQNSLISGSEPDKLSALNAQNQGIEQTAVPMAHANLGLSQARIPALQASTSATQENTRLAPLGSAIQAQNAINMQAKMGQTGSRFGQMYQLSKGLSSMAPPAREAWIAQNQGAYNQMLHTLASPQPQAQGPSMNVLSPELFKNSLGYSPQMSQPAPAQAQSQSPQPGSVPQESLGPQSADDQLVARANQMSANQKLTTTAQQNRYQAGVAMEKFLNNPQMSDQLNKLGTYAGLKGSAEKYWDMATNNPRYTQYKSSVSQMAPILSGGISQLEGFAKTNQGLNEGLNYFKRAQDVLGNNPEQAEQYINTGKQILSSELQSIKQTNQPLFSLNRQQGVSDINPGHQNLIAGAPALGGASMPSFSNKADFQKWYGGLNSAQQAQARSQLGGK